MSLLEKASLVITPNAYKESKLYSVVPNTTLGDMTVVRATTATRVNSAGLIELVPYNLLEYSEQFDNAIWTKQNVTITANATTSPDGTANADRIFETAISGNHGLFQSINLSTATNYVVSCFVKKGNRDYCGLQFFYNAGNGTVAFFNLLNGTLIYEFAEGAGYSITNSNITNVGNGWYRLSATVQVGHIDSAPGIVLASTQWSTGTSYDNAYLGDVTKYVDSWGFQLVAGTLPKDYLRTETRLNIPRIDYSNGSCPSILVEPQRTNLALYSEQFDNLAWMKGDATINANSIISPDGTQNADALIESTSPNVNHRILPTSPFFGIANTNYTFSVYVKKKGATRHIYWMCQFGTNAIYVHFNMTNFTINEVTSNGNGSNASASISPVGNDWYKITLSGIVSNISGDYYNQFYTENVVSSGFTPITYTGDGVSGFYLYGWQIELGSYATSYIPTVASTVTRNADLISKTGISSLIGTNFTIFLDAYQSIGGNNSRYIVLKGSGGTYANAIFFESGATNQIFLTILDNSSSAVFSSASGILTDGQRIKLAVRCKNNDFAYYLNGVQVGVQASGTVPTTADLYLGYYYDYGDNYNNINSAIIFNSALSNAELAQLTTI